MKDRVARLKKVWVKYRSGLHLSHWATHDDRFEAHNKSHGADRWWLVVDTTGKKHSKYLLDCSTLQECREAIAMIQDEEKEEKEDE